jgi:hypothetical protein
VSCLVCACTTFNSLPALSATQRPSSTGNGTGVLDDSTDHGLETSSHCLQLTMILGFSARQGPPPTYQPKVRREARAIPAAVLFKPVSH